jgi:hypothetical protein
MLMDWRDESSQARDNAGHTVRILQAEGHEPALEWDVSEEVLRARWADRTRASRVTRGTASGARAEGPAVRVGWPSDTCTELTATTATSPNQRHTPATVHAAPTPPDLAVRYT